MPVTGSACLIQIVLRNVKNDKMNIRICRRDVNNSLGKCKARQNQNIVAFFNRLLHRCLTILIGIGRRLLVGKFDPVLFRPALRRFVRDLVKRLIGDISVVCNHSDLHRCRRLRRRCRRCRLHVVGLLAAAACQRKRHERSQCKTQNLFHEFLLIENGLRHFIIHFTKTVTVCK